MQHEIEQHSYIDQLHASLKAGRDPFPRIVEIHPTDICNHRCDYCFHGGVGYDHARKNDVLTLDRYRDLFSELAVVGVRNLSVAGGGEPLIDKRLPDILRAALSADLSVRVVTHGALVAGDVVGEILKCREVRFSIDAIRPETYEAIRHINGRQLKITLDNLQRLVVARNAANASLKIGATFLISTKNLSELDEFCDQIFGLGVDSITIKHDIYGTPGISDEAAETLRNVMRARYGERLDFRARLPAGTKLTSCYAPYLMTVVNPYGEVFSCALGSQPNDTNGYVLGDIKTESLSHIWMRSADLRLMLRSSTVHCTNCNHTDVLVNSALRQLMLRESTA